MRVRASLFGVLAICAPMAAQAFVALGDPHPGNVVYACEVQDTDIDQWTRVNMGFSKTGQFWVTTDHRGHETIYGRTVLWHNPWGDFLLSAPLQTRHGFDIVGRGLKRLEVAPDGAARLTLAQYDAADGTAFTEWRMTCNKGEAY